MAVTDFSDAVQLTIDLANAYEGIITGTADDPDVITPGGQPVPPILKVYAALQAFIDSISSTLLAARDQAVAAEAGAVTASAIIGSYPNSAETTVPAGVASGAFYWALTADGNHLRQWKNNAGTPQIVSPTISIATAAVVDALSALVTAMNASLTALNAQINVGGAYEGILTQFLGPNDELLGQFADDGKFYANLAVSLGTQNGLALVFDPTTFKTTLSLGTVEGQLPVGDWKIDSTFLCEGVAFQILGPNNEVIYQVFEDSTTVTDPAVTAMQAELALAAGSQPDLHTRLNNGLDAQGVPLHHIYGNGFIREIRSRIRQRLLGQSTTLNLVLGPGDSYCDIKTIWSTNFATYLRTLIGSAGHGWTGFGYPNAGGNSGYQRGNAFPAEVTVSFQGTGWTGQFTSAQGSPDLCSATSSTAADNIRVSKLVSGNNSAVNLHYLPGAGTGVIQYRWNGGSWTTLNLPVVSGLGASIALASVPAGAWTLDFQVVSGTVQLAGVDLQEAGPGLRIHNICNNGSSAGNWGTSGNQTELALAWGRLGQIHGFISMLGTNDQGQGWSYAQYFTSYSNLVATMLAASPACDRILLCPAENGRGLPLLLSQYQLQQRLVAKANKLCQVNLQELFGDNIADYRFSNSNRSWLQADDLHPNTTGGGCAILDEVIRLITTTA